MRAELKSIIISDIDIDNYWPDEEDNFCFYLQANIGVEGRDGGDIFGFSVCTPKWILENRSKDQIFFMRDTIIVFEYDIERVKSVIKNLCDRTFGENWLEIAEKLKRFGYWEFEDYDPYKDKV